MRRSTYVMYSTDLGKKGDAVRSVEEAIISYTRKQGVAPTHIVLREHMAIQLNTSLTVVATDKIAPGHFVLGQDGKFLEKP